MYHENINVFNNVFDLRQQCNLETILPHSERKLYLWEPTSLKKCLRNSADDYGVHSVIRLKGQ